MAVLANPQHERFAFEYTKDHNGTQAAMRAGYAPTGAHVQASRLLRSPKVHARITELEREAAEASGTTPEWIRAQLRLVAERCMQAKPVLNRKGEPVYTEVQDRAGNTTAIVPAYTFDASGATRALELLGKDGGMFIERTEDVTPHEAALDEIAPPMAEDAVERPTTH